MRKLGQIASNGTPSSMRPPVLGSFTCSRKYGPVMPTSVLAPECGSAVYSACALETGRTDVSASVFVTISYPAPMRLHCTPIAAAVARLSPVHMRVTMPASSARAMARGTSGRTGSRTPITITIVSSFAATCC